MFLKSLGVAWFDHLGKMIYGTFLSNHLLDGYYNQGDLCHNALLD